MSDSRFARSAGSLRSFPVLGLVAMAAVAGACNAKPGSGPAPSADAWAVVDGREIKRDDVEKAFRRAMQAQAPPSEEEALNAKLNLLNEMIVQDILIAKAGALKIEVPEAELNTAYDAGKKDVPPEQFQQELTRRQITEADMKEGLRRELLVQKLLEKEVTAKAAVTDQEIANFYNANKAQFNFPEEAYHLAQIVVTPVRDQELNNRSGDDATTPEQAIQKANMLMERLKGGAQFADLARDFSEDSQSAPRGGDLGFIPVSALNQAPPPLRDSVLKSSPGTVSAVSIGGAHSIVLLVSKEAAGQRDLSTATVRDGISATLKNRKEALLRTAYLTNARSEANVVNVIAKKVLESPGTLPTVMPKAPGTP
ncbi:MAG: SurA N-terminal domain-containing protein [Acidobacteria bacterium]|nr:SurA N-terminal domain-containing protein [Acidobacteriota bacterium]